MKPRLRINKKKAMMLELKRQHPDLSEVYIKKEYHKLINSDSYRSGTSTIWLHDNGITQCCMCRSWDRVDDKYKMCGKCHEEREESKRLKFLRFQRKQGLELELGY